MVSPLFDPVLHVVLDRPRIAGNVGAIARLCAATDCALHVCGPFPFDLGPTVSAQLKRSGVDAWPGARVHFHLSTERCLTLLARQPEPQPPVVVEVSGTVRHDQVGLARGSVVVLGPEDGSVGEAHVRQARACVRLPTTGAVRSLNLAQCAAVVVFEALRQQGYPNLA